MNNSGRSTSDNSDNYGKKILIVDDEDAFRYFAKEILTEHGYICFCTENVRKSRILLEEQVFDLVISDIRMPDEDGFDLCRYIKSRHLDIAIMLITAVGDLEMARQAIPFDVYGYLIKPVLANQLKISDANAMRRRQLEAQEIKMRDRLEKMVDEKTAHLAKINRELEIRENELHELNTALKVLLRKVQEEKENMEESVLLNVNRSILPHLECLRRGNLNRDQKNSLEIALKNIYEIISPFNKNISASIYSLSPAEIQIANLIKQGMSTKDIASTLNLSANTVMKHRANIRDKLNIRKQKNNLFTLLSALT